MSKSNSRRWANELVWGQPSVAAIMVPRPDGGYVEASDYDALLSEKAALAAENERLRTQLRESCREERNDFEGVACPVGYEVGRLQAELSRLRSAIAGAREALRDAADTYEIERGKAGSEWHSKLLTKWIDQLRALSSIGDLPAGEEG